MIDIDGSAKSGSGTILRYSVALASLLGKELHIYNIRAKRDKPGLRPQHLASVKACAELCGAKVEGAKENSQEITYRPGRRIKGGQYRWEIGTAGSTTLLASSLLPITLFAEQDCMLHISGGLFQDFAPSAHHMQHVLLPTLRKMDIEAELEVVRPGYVPRGGGIIQLSIKPLKYGVQPVRLLEPGKVKSMNGVALSSHLKEKRISERMAESCQSILAGNGYHATIELVLDDTASQAGASLTVWAETDTGCLLGTDQAGKVGRSSEHIGKYVARSLIEDLRTGATVDRYLADQLIIYAALAEGITEYIVPRITEHVESNLWLVEKFGAKTKTDGKVVRIEGIGYRKGVT